MAIFWMRSHTFLLAPHPCVKRMADSATNVFYGLTEITWFSYKTPPSRRTTKV